MTALRRARRALRKAQRELDLGHPALGDLWAVLDSMASSLELWEEENSEAECDKGN